VNEFFEEERHRCEEKIMQEIWKDVVGYEGIYMVSSFGRMKSKERIVERKKMGNYFQKEAIIEGSEYHGYKVTTIVKNKIKKNKFIHVLIAEAFLGPKPEKMEVCHNDGDRKNNAIENLRYGTRSDNVRDSIKHGTYKRPPIVRGSKRSDAKINEEIAKQIKESDESSYILAKKLNISRALISNVRRNKSWTHVN
jgi:hypothetical protein